MKISSKQLADLRRQLRTHEPIVYYIAAGEKTTIGYRILKDRPTQETLDANGVKIFQVDNPQVVVPTNCSLVRVGGQGSRLYAVVTIQGPGPIRYQWIDHEGTTHNVNIFASLPGEDVDAAIQAATDYFRRQGSIWRVANRAKSTLAAAKAAFDAVQNQLSLAYAALELAEYAKKAHKTSASALSALESLQGKNNRAHQIKIFRELGIKRDHQTVIKVIRGAIAALKMKLTSVADE